MLGKIIAFWFGISLIFTGGFVLGACFNRKQKPAK